MGVSLDVLVIFGLVAFGAVHGRSTTPAGAVENTSTEKTKSGPETVPSSVKHPLNVPSVEEMANNIAGPSASETATSRCQALKQIPPMFCMLQSAQKDFPCTVDADCFVPGHVCCPHYCDTKVCKNT